MLVQNLSIRLLQTGLRRMLESLPIDLVEALRDGDYITHQQQYIDKDVVMLSLEVALMCEPVQIRKRTMKKTSTNHTARHARYDITDVINRNTNFNWSTNMKDLTKIALIAASVVASSASIAEIKTSANATDVEMHPMQAYTLDLSDHTAVVYYVVQENGDYQIVTTIGPNVGVTGNTSQHRVVMSSDQSRSFNVGNGESSSEIIFTSTDGALFVGNR